MVDRSPTTADRERADLLLQLLSQRLEVRKLRVKDAKKRESWAFRSFVERNLACVAAAVVVFGHIKRDLSRPPPSVGGLDLDSRSSGCARLGGEVGPPLGVVVEEVAVLVVVVRRHRHAVRAAVRRAVDDETFPWQRPRTHCSRRGRG